MKNLISAIAMFALGFFITFAIIKEYSFTTSLSKLPSFERKAGVIVSSNGGISSDDKDITNQLKTLSNNYGNIFNVVIDKDAKEHQPFGTQIQYKIHSNIKILSNSDTEKPTYTSSTYGG